MNTEKRVERDPVTHERFGRGLAGLTVMATVVLGYLHSPYWLLIALGVAANLALSALTDRCAVKNLLIRLGLPGERDLGRAEVLGFAPTASNALLSGRPAFTDRRRPDFFVREKSDLFSRLSGPRGGSYDEGKAFVNAMRP